MKIKKFFGKTVHKIKSVRGKIFTIQPVINLCFTQDTQMITFSYQMHSDDNLQLSDAPAPEGQLC